MDLFEVLNDRMHGIASMKQENFLANGLSAQVGQDVMSDVV